MGWTLRKQATHSRTTAVDAQDAIGGGEKPLAAAAEERR
jgi:hypothetical protein